MLSGFMALVVIAAFIPQATWAAVPTQSPAAGSVSAAFHAASVESGVPEELLLAIGFVNTRWRMETSEDHGVGIMHLVHDPQADTLARAAALTGASESTLAHDVGANIRGGAAVISAAAGNPTPADLNGWRAAVASVGGGALYAEQVFQVLNQGASETIPGGERIVLTPHSAIGAAASTARAASPDYGGANWVPASTSNFTASSRPSSYVPNRIVIHVAEGSYAGTIRYFQNPSAQASSHFVVRSGDGAVTQVVREQDVAWHAGNWDYNTRSIGIEHEGFVNNPSWFTDAMYRSSAQLVATMVRRFSIPIDRQHIVGHNEVPDPMNPTLSGGRDHHTDPGRFWNWNLYMSYVRGYAGAYCGSNGAVAGAWQKIPGAAYDIGVGANGAVWVIGTDPAMGGYSIYQWTGSSWIKSNGAATRIAVDAAGVPWVINVYGNIYRHVTGGWQQIPGSAMDIGAGADGSVWAIGANETNGGFGIYRWTGSGWQAIDGGATRISVGPDGNPWAINNLSLIYKRVPGGWVQLPGWAYDIGVAPNTAMTVVGSNRLCGGYGLWTWNGSSWYPVGGAAVGLSLGPDGKAWVVNENQDIYHQA
jgi:hypothetical protein